MSNQPGTKCWQSIFSKTITIVEPSSSTINRFVEGRFLSKDDLIALSVMVAAEIYAKQNCGGAASTKVPEPINSLPEFLYSNPMVMPVTIKGREEKSQIQGGAIAIEFPKGVGFGTPAKIITEA